MGQILHGSATTTDFPTCRQRPKQPQIDRPGQQREEAVVVAFRRHTLLPLDDCLYALQPTIPHLTRSSLHRCLQRHGISRLPQVEGEASAKRKFKAYPIGSFHIDLAEVRTAQGKLYLIVAIDRTSKFAFVEMHEKVARRTAGLPAPPDRRRPLQGPYRPHRQRNPLHHTRQYGLRRPRTSRPPCRLESSFGRTPSNTPAPRTTSIIG